MKLPVPAAVLWSGCYPDRIYPLARPRLSGLRIYQPLTEQKALRAWMASLRPEIPFRCDMWVECIFIFKTRSEPDIDNLLKAILDGLQSAQIIGNDRRVVGLSAMRVISDHDECQIKIREALHYDPEAVPNAGSGRRLFRTKSSPKSWSRVTDRVRKKPRRDAGDRSPV